MKSFLLLIFLFQFSISNAQLTFDWARAAGGAGQDVSLSVDIDKTGNVYTTGMFSGSVDFDPGPGINLLNSNGFLDIFVMKTSPTGAFIWARNMGSGKNDKGKSIDVDRDGNSYITGQFGDTVDFDPGTGNFFLAAAGVNPDIFVLSLDPSGDFRWAISAGSNSHDYGYSLALDPKFENTLCVTGSFTNTVDFDPGPGSAILSAVSYEDVFILKTDTAGNFIWAKRLGGPASQTGFAITIDLFGNIYTTGDFWGTCDFDPGPGVYNLTATRIDPFVSKLNKYGDFVWAKSFCSPDDDYGESIATDSYGNVYVTGEFTGTCDFDTGPGIQNLVATGTLDIFTVKLDNAGNTIWAKSLSGNQPNLVFSIALDDQNNSYTTGYFQGTADFDPGPGVDSSTAFGMQDIFIWKLDESGNALWNEQVGDSASAEKGYDIIIGANNVVVITGSFAGTCDFDPNSSTYSMSAVGSSDCYTEKFCQPPPPPDSISGPSVVCEGATQAFSIPGDPTALSYNWLLPPGWNGNSTANLIYVIPDSSGTVSVYTSTSCGDSDTISIFVFVDPCTDIVENADNLFAVYPNPNNGQFDVHSEMHNNKTADILVTDINGRQVWKGSKKISLNGDLKMDLRELDEGMYFIRITQDAGKQEGKFIVRRF